MSGHKLLYSGLRQLAGFIEGMRMASVALFFPNAKASDLAVGAFAEYFHANANIRSREFLTGYSVGLQRGIDNGFNVGPCPYDVGTAAADAWAAGFSEGQVQGIALFCSGGLDE